MPPYPCLPITPEFMFPMSMLNGHGPTLRHPLSSSRAKGSIAVQARAGKVHLCLCPRMRLRLRLHLGYLLAVPTPAAPAVCICICTCDYGAMPLSCPGGVSWSTGPRASPPMYLCPQACRGILDGPAA